jgi:hypothetical protein
MSAFSVQLAKAVENDLQNRSWEMPVEVRRTYRPRYDAGAQQKMLQVSIFPSQININIQSRSKGGADRYQLGITLIRYCAEEDMAQCDAVVTEAENVADFLRERHYDQPPAQVVEVNVDPNYAPAMLKERSQFVSGMDVSFVDQGI